MSAKNKRGNKDKEISVEKNMAKQTEKVAKFSFSTLEMFLLLVLIVGFFAVAFSAINNFVKAAGLLLILFASGAVISKLTGASSYYGLVIIRTKRGFNLMKSIADSHPKLVNGLSDLGLSFGFGAIYSFLLFRGNVKKFLFHLLVLVVLFASASFSASVPLNNMLMSAFGILFGLAGIGLLSIVAHAFNIATVPGTPAGVMPVVPGVTVPWEAIFAIAIIAIIHETAHGVMFYVEKLKVKHSGALLFGFLPIGAFVEPDEAQFKKHNLTGKRRILVAGSASNFYAMLLFLPFSMLAFMAVSSLSGGILINNVVAGSAADGMLAKGMVVTAVNGMQTLDFNSFVSQLQKIGPNGRAELTLVDGSKRVVTLSKEGKMGVEAAPFIPPGNSLPYAIANFLAIVLQWTVLLNLALAVINLLPLFVTDGHQLLVNELENIMDKKKAKLIANSAGVITVLILLFNLFPFFK